MLQLNQPGICFNNTIEISSDIKENTKSSNKIIAVAMDTNEVTSNNYIL